MTSELAAWGLAHDLMSAALLGQLCFVLLRRGGFGGAGLPHLTVRLMDVGNCLSPSPELPQATA